MHLVFVLFQDSDSKKLDKKESTGPPLQTASVSVRALIEEKIISRRGATASSASSNSKFIEQASYSLIWSFRMGRYFFEVWSETIYYDVKFNFAGTSSDSAASRAGFVAPAPPPLSTIRASAASPASPAPATSAQFASPRAPPAATAATNAPANIAQARDSTLIELLKKGSTKVRSNHLSTLLNCNYNITMSFFLSPGREKISIRSRTIITATRLHISTRTIRSVFQFRRRIFLASAQ